MTTPKQTILARMADEARHTAKTTRIDLDAFLALSSAERGARWRQWDIGAKMDAVIQGLERQGYTWDDATVAANVAHWDAKWECQAEPTDLAVPPAAAILALVSDRIGDARQHGDVAGVRQLDRIRVNIQRGARLSWCLGDLLIQSVNNPGVVYSVNRAGCSCPNGAAGKAACWHVALFDLLLDMLDTEAETADMESGDDGTGGANPIPHAARAAAWLSGQQQLAARLDATAAYLAELRQAQARVALPAPAPKPLRVRLVEARRKSPYFTSAFYLSRAA